jgi:hypothetical protein
VVVYQGKTPQIFIRRNSARDHPCGVLDDFPCLVAVRFDGLGEQVDAETTVPEINPDLAIRAVGSETHRQRTAQHGLIFFLQQGVGHLADGFVKNQGQNWA